MKKDNVDICFLNFENKDIELIKEKGFNTFDGSLGKKVRINYNAHQNYFHCLSNHNFPSNLHEYEVLAINMNNEEIIPYNPFEHIRKENPNKEEVKFKIRMPANIFDPIPFSSSILREKIWEFIQNPSIIIIFALALKKLEYELTLIEDGGYERTESNFIANNYSFIENIPLGGTKHGKRYNIVAKNKTLEDFLLKFSDFEYYQTFYFPEIWDNNEKKHFKDPNFIPLIENNSNEIISYAYSYPNTILYVFPDICNKGELIEALITEICPQFLPDLFKYSNKINWIEDEDYWLPNHEILVQEIENENIAHLNKLKELETKIEENKNKYSFLNDLITATADKLVSAVITVLGFIEFDNIIKVDNEKEGEILEEDIQIIDNERILVIEVKGIGGTSKDSECSQVSKIRFRRMIQKNTMNVFALYIVNNERYKPPHLRQNPPFNPIQIQDAINDRRGLLTTWDLYNLYNDINNDIITKEEARLLIFDYGLINFRKNLKYIARVEKIYPQNNVASIDLTNNIELSINDFIISEKKGKIRKHKILSIQQNKKVMEKVLAGKTGLKLDPQVEQNSNLYLK